MAWAHSPWVMFSFPDDRMQMANDDLHDVAQPGALRMVHAGDDVARQFRKDLRCRHLSSLPIMTVTLLLWDGRRP